MSTGARPDKWHGGKSYRHSRDFELPFVICGNQLAFLRTGLQGKICCPSNSTVARAKESSIGPTKMPMMPNAFAPPSRA